MAQHWIAHVEVEELRPLVPVSAAWSLDDVDAGLQYVWDEAEHRATAPAKQPKKIAYKKKRPGGSAPKSRQYWREIKREFYALLCTDDAKYAGLRQQLSAVTGKQSLLIVAHVSAAISAVVGVVSGLCFPVVAYLLLAATTVGKNAWCTVNAARPRKKKAA